MFENVTVFNSLVICQRIQIRDGARSENLGGKQKCGGHNLLPMVEIFPESGEGMHPRYPPTLIPPLVLFIHMY